MGLGGYLLIGATLLGLFGMAYYLATQPDITGNGG